MGNICFKEEEDTNEKLVSIKDMSRTTGSTEKSINELIQSKDQFSILVEPPRSKQVTLQDSVANADMQDTITYYKYETCYRCQQVIETMKIQLQCLHVFHEDCLIELLKEQLERENAILYCICQCKITAKILILLKTPKQYLERLYKLQINEIAKKYKLIKCNKCKFIYYNKDNTPCQCL